MEFLSPTAIAAAAALTIPPLVALYFLKLKRNEHPVPSTLLWKRTVEDLQVNAPFQRLRSSLLLLLQLLVLIAAAVALGKPMFQTAERHESTLVLLIDRSASMAVVEEEGRSRLKRAKEQAKRVIDTMGEDSRAMVIAFADGATVASSFDTSKEALKRRIDSIEPTHGPSRLAEAVNLAEAYAQNLVIGGEEFGSDIAPESSASPASVFLFTDGRVADLADVAVEKFDPQRMHLVNVAERRDNAGIIAMDARRRYEQPQMLEVTAVVQNFGPDPARFDAVLYVEGVTVDVQTVELDAAAPDHESASGDAPRQGPSASVATVAFDDIEFEGSGVVEVFLRTEDGLSADNRAWTIIPSPRRTRVLLVSDGNPHFNPLSEALRVLPVELSTMTTADYESADEQSLSDGRRSLFDVVIFEDHSTSRLFWGNYLFFGGVPRIEGVSAEGVINDEIIFNWDETHPVLRHVFVESIELFQWQRLQLPPDAVSLIDGATSPVLSYLARDASQYLIAAFPLVVRDERGQYRYNTYWVHGADFVVFVYNAIQFLGSNVATTGVRTLRPGEPASVPVPADVDHVTVHRPDGDSEREPAPSRQTLHYARTRHVGVYRVEPGVEGRERFAVNLFDPVESRIEPASGLSLGGGQVAAQAGTVQVNEPAWRYLVLALFVLLLLEWVIYNQRVFV